jgi:hypothetical protein
MEINVVLGGSGGFDPALDWLRDQEGVHEA